jgi:hypothetical protein
LNIPVLAWSEPISNQNIDSDQVVSHTKGIVLPQQETRTVAARGTRSGKNEVRVGWPGRQNQNLVKRLWIQNLPKPGVLESMIGQSQALYEAGGFNRAERAGESVN